MLSPSGRRAATCFAWPATGSCLPGRLGLPDGLVGRVRGRLGFPERGRRPRPRPSWLSRRARRLRPGLPGVLGGGQCGGAPERPPTSPSPSSSAAGRAPASRRSSTPSWAAASCAPAAPPPAVAARDAAFIVADLPGYGYAARARAFLADLEAKVGRTDPPPDRPASPEKPSQPPARRRGCGRLPDAGGRPPTIGRSDWTARARSPRLCARRRPQRAGSPDLGALPRRIRTCRRG